MLNFEINNLTRDKIEKKYFKEIAENTFKILKLKKPKEISLVFVCDTRIKNLNKKYRKKDKITDVLAFDYGEIFICSSQAKKQAKKLGHSLKKELSILLIHGILHLAGYKDQTEKNRSKMLKKQKEVCQKVI